MRITQNRILLIVPPETKDVRIREILISKGYEILVAPSLIAALQKVSEIDLGLVVCNHQVGDQTGFNVFNSLQPFLTVKEIPFILYMKEFVKEDVLIGLEIGIDNFIIEPFEQKALLQKVERQLMRRQQKKVFDTERFNLFFEGTPVAKFIAENERLVKVNGAFANLTRLDKKEIPLPRFDELFDFNCNKIHELDFRKCIMRLKEYCLFKSVPLRNDRTLTFDIHMVLNDYFGRNLFTGEVIPLQPQALLNGNGKSEPGKQVMLTEREKQVLELSGKGFSIKQIAAELGISARTIEKHRANIMEKTKSSNIIEAICYFQ